MPLTALAAASILAVGARAAPATSPPPMQVQIVTAGEFGPSAGSSLVASRANGEVRASAAFQPAPVPDPDAGPPQGASARGPSLTPALFAHKEEFNGDGYASDSDPDHGLDKRRTPAAGLNLSVPVK